MMVIRGDDKWDGSVILMDIHTGSGVDADGIRGCRDGGGQAYMGL